MIEMILQQYGINAETLESFKKLLQELYKIPGMIEQQNELIKLLTHRIGELESTNFLLAEKNVDLEKQILKLLGELK